MSARPRVGVSVSARSGWRVFPFFALAIRRAGGVPERIQTNRSRSGFDALDAVIIGGGDDIHFSLYDGEIVTEATFDRDRDRLELDLIDAAEQRLLPILGVCRGAQLLNVARGGTLHQDIYEVYPEARRMKTPLPRKDITFDPESRLAAICGPEPGRVNALHSQSVDRLGEAMRPVAWDSAGVVQAVECTGQRLVVGVQWHPEYLVFSRRDQALFRALVKAVEGRVPAPAPPVVGQPHGAAPGPLEGAAAQAAETEARRAGDSP